MNNMPFPYMYSSPNQMTPILGQQNKEEIKKLQYEIERLKERVNALEQKNKKDYLKKEDGLYMM